ASSPPVSARSSVSSSAKAFRSSLPSRWSILPWSGSASRRCAFPTCRTSRTPTMVVFILIGSTVFSVVFLGVSGGVWLEHHLTSLPGGVWGFLIFINLFLFFLAFFLDFFEIAFIILPMVAPIAQKVLAPVVGPDAALIWFGVMLCVNMQTSFLHP